MQVINVAAYPSQLFRVVLAGQHCTILLYQRGGSIFINLAVGSVPVCAGAICRDRVSIVQNATPDFTGSLFFADTLGNSDPTWESLGSRYLFIYVEPGEDADNVIL